MNRQAFRLVGVGVAVSAVAILGPGLLSVEAQTIAGCGTTAIPKADANSIERLTLGIRCRETAIAIGNAGIEARRERVKALTPAPTPTPTPVPTPTPTPAAVTWIDCAKEDSVCAVPGRALVRYGAADKFRYLTASAPVTCGNKVFGDPITGTVKSCSYSLNAPVPAGTAAAPAVVVAPTPTPTPAPAAGVPPMSIGVNVAPSVYYGTERTFANLAAYAGGWKDPSAGWGNLADDRTSSTGFPTINGAALSLNVPQPVWSNQPVTVTCTWSGDGALRVDGDTRAGTPAGAKAVTFTWPGYDRTKGSRPSILLYLTGVTTTAPFTDLDCREPGLKVVGQFDARLIDDLRPFRVLRFLDWSNTNGNPASVTLANRATTARGGMDGIPIEVQIDLANAVGADPWFTIAYNADADYVRAMAKLAHDKLAPGHRAYFELSNEVWNFAFPVATQAVKEGAGQVPPLSSDYYSNNPLRYAERLIEFHKIVTGQFADDMTRVVRVAAAQNDNSWSARSILAFRDVPAWIDALATGPYFGHSFFNAPYDKVTAADLPAMFDRLEAARANSIAKALENKAAAAKYSKRFIAYEAGQHVIAPAALQSIAELFQRDPRMGVIYDRFLADWRDKIGDEITMYSATGSIGQYGAWGLREYPGQPIAETPKRRAVLDAAKAVGQ